MAQEETDYYQGDKYFRGVSKPCVGQGLAPRSTVALWTTQDGVGTNSRAVLSLGPAPYSSLCLAGGKTEALPAAGWMRRCLAYASEATLFKHLSGKREWPALEKAAKSQ